MFCIVGLGNPGDEYKRTRHNIGWIVLESILEKRNFSKLVQSSKYTGLIAQGVISGTNVGFLFPTTYMNSAGTSVMKYLKDTGGPSTLIVVHDEIDIPFGDVKVSYDRGSGGHNGVKSVIDAVGSKQFVRIRVGIGQKNIFGVLKRPQGDALSTYVLGVFKNAEVSQLPLIAKRADTLLELIVTKGIEHAMQAGNKGA
jgi:PTH1 family peptidyl-tRNA hydrolase